MTVGRSDERRLNLPGTDYADLYDPLTARNRSDPR